MKILFLTTHLNRGGITTYIKTLALSLKSRGHQVIVASCGEDAVEELKESGICHLKISTNTKCEVNPKLLIAFLKARAIVKRERIEIIHAHTRVTQVLGTILSKSIGVRLITTCHGFFNLNLGRKLLPCWGRKTIAISEPVRECLINRMGISKDRISLIHNGVDVNRFKGTNKKEAKERLGLNDAPVIGITSRLSSGKGHQSLLQAAEIILKERGDIQFLIVGDGPFRDRLIKIAEDLKIKEKITFAGKTADVLPFLQAMDIFVHPSSKEGLGLSILEAMALGLPVVASDTGGIYIAVRENRTGLLVPPGDYQCLADGIMRFLRDPSLIMKMGEEARKVACEEFGLEDMVKRVEEVYKEVLDEN